MNINFYFQGNENLKRLSLIKEEVPDYFYPKVKNFNEENYLHSITKHFKGKSEISSKDINFISTRYLYFKDVPENIHINSVVSNKPRGLSSFVIDLKTTDKKLIRNSYKELKKLGYNLSENPLTNLGIITLKVPPLIAINEQALGSFLYPIKYSNLEVNEIDIFYGDSVISIPEPRKTEPLMAEGKNFVWPPDKNLDINKRRLRNSLRTIKVAVIDTGIDETHPDLSGLVKDKYDVTGEGNTDLNGHGTWCASAIGGKGIKSEKTKHPFYQRKYEGIAPEVQLSAYKFLTKSGHGTTQGALKCFERAADKGVDITSNSWGGGSCSNIPDIIERTINRLFKEYGILSFISAGNSGPEKKTISSPAGAEFGIAVGAIERNKKIASFSSRGPHPNSELIKPDVVSLGVNVIGALAKESLFKPIPDNKWYTSLSGTSMACPISAGIAALLIALDSS